MVAGRAFFSPPDTMIVLGCVVDGLFQCTLNAAVLAGSMGAIKVVCRRFFDSSGVVNENI